MVFNSYSFLLFFPIVLVLTQLAPAKWRNGLLLVASYVFYASWGKRFCVLLLGLTVLVYAAGLLLGQKKRRWLFWLGLGGTLGALLVYKYLDFGLYSINALIRALGLGEPMPRVSLLQPAGISFFTFQAAGYLIDVYRGKYKPEKNFLQFALFVSFFPQLLSGPIGRGDQLLPQYERPKKADFDALRRGFLTMTWGFFLKLCIADRAAVLVNTVYGAFESYSGIFLVFATAVYALQIYGDFAGYSYMAIGGAEMLGIHLPKNFDTPYFAQSVQEFWRRWHISLSSWFRDYVYIPLGGNRVSKPRWFLNILVVWMLTGLWHGASWNFVLWGLVFAAFLVLEKLLPGLGKLPKGLANVYVLAVVVFSFVLFNASNLSQAGQDLAGMLGLSGLPLVTTESLYQLKSFAVLFLLGILGATPLPKKWGEAMAQKAPWLDAAAMLALLLVCTAYLVDGSFNPFLYFRF